MQTMPQHIEKKPVSNITTNSSSNYQHMIILNQIRALTVLPDSDIKYIIVRKTHCFCSSSIRLLLSCWSGTLLRALYCANLGWRNFGLFETEPANETFNKSVCSMLSTHLLHTVANVYWQLLKWLKRTTTSEIQMRSLVLAKHTIPRCVYYNVCVLLNSIYACFKPFEIAITNSDWHHWKFLRSDRNGNFMKIFLHELIAHYSSAN